MYQKHVISAFLLLGMLLLLSCNSVVGEGSEEKRLVYNMPFFLGLKICITAPYQARPGETINVTIEAEVSGNTHVEFINISIYGTKNETLKTLLRNISIDDSGIPQYTEYPIGIRNDSSPGLVYGYIAWKWTHEGATISPPPAGFVVTYVKNVELEKVQVAYDQLNATYLSLLANDTELKSYQSDYGSTRNLMYIFGATTIFAAVTALILLTRRPKPFWT